MTESSGWTARGIGVTFRIALVVITLASCGDEGSDVVVSGHRTERTSTTTEAEVKESGAGTVDVGALPGATGPVVAAADPGSSTSTPASPQPAGAQPPPTAAWPTPSQQSPSAQPTVTPTAQPAVPTTASPTVPTTASPTVPTVPTTTKVPGANPIEGGVQIVRTTTSGSFVFKAPDADKCAQSNWTITGPTSAQQSKSPWDDPAAGGDGCWTTPHELQQSWTTTRAPLKRGHYRVVLETRSKSGVTTGTHWAEFECCFDYNR